jgi:paraquat-inducible protein B
VSDEIFPIPHVQFRKRGRPSAVWIVPIIAIVAAGALAVRTYLHTGPTIHITFNTADGIEGGKSEVRYKNVPVGKVTSVSLTPDRQHIVATVQLTSGGGSLATKGTQFWVERPRIGIGGISGLGTLLSGAFIGVDVGTSTEKVDSFVGLEKPPGVTSDQHGTRYKLTTTDAGSLAPQSPVYVQRQSVGSILAIDLGTDGKTVNMEIFVSAPYDHLVTQSTVFWNASGLDVTLDASGLRVNTESLATVVAGGIEFGVRPGAPPTPPAAENQRFHLFPDLRHAMAKPDATSLALEMRFDQPIRGTATGVNVEFEGIHIGEVVDITPDYDETTHTFHFDAHASVFPERLGPAYAKLAAEGARNGLTGPQTLQALVDRGLRAQIKSSNILTGAYYIDLAWFPNAKPAHVTAKDGVWVVPTERGGSEQMQERVASILAKIDRIPFEEIGGDVHDATRAASSLLGHFDNAVVPAMQGVFARADTAMSALRDSLAALRDNVAAPDSAIQQTTRATLEQVERAAFSLRTLADYLSHHPESLVRGRASGSEPKSK